jgi:DNA-binding NarL/FixJ family response regulator
VNCQKSFKASDRAEKIGSRHRKVFVFTDKRTGARRFELQAGADGTMPFDEAVSLLAVNCLMRNQIPDDFSVLISAWDNYPDSLRKRALKLIETCTLMQSSVRLTTRQHEALRGIQEGLSNKEISVKMHLSERTVKFHVSALLAKFNVTRRMALMLKASELLSTVKLPNSVDTPPQLSNDENLGAQQLRFSREGPINMNHLERRARG